MNEDSLDAARAMTDRLVREQDADVTKWAEAFVMMVRHRPEIATDEGTMIGWFANAMMADRASQAAKRPEPTWDQTTEGQEWIKDVNEHMTPKLRESAMAAMLVPDETDVKFGVELGMSIMMDKPILLVVRPGTKVPEHLARVADRIVEGGLDDPTTQERLVAAIKSIPTQRT